MDQILGTAVAVSHRSWGCSNIRIASWLRCWEGEIGSWIAWESNSRFVSITVLSQWESSGCFGLSGLRHVKHTGVKFLLLWRLFQSYLGGSSCLTGGAPDLLDCPEEQQEEGRGLHCCMEGAVHPNDLILVFLELFYLRGLQQRNAGFHQQKLTQFLWWHHHCSLPCLPGAQVSAGVRDSGSTPGKVQGWCAGGRAVTTLKTREVNDAQQLLIIWGHFLLFSEHSILR